jgi:hypothetical protein
MTSVLPSGNPSQRRLAMQPPHLDEERDALAQIIWRPIAHAKVIARIRDF